MFQISHSCVHRIVASLVPRLAALVMNHRHDRRWSWIVDGTLIPTRDHATAAKSKNYRWSCNAQVLVRRRDLGVIATSAGGPGNRNDVVHYRGSIIEALSIEHGRTLADAVTAVSPSSSRRCSRTIASFVISVGVAIVIDEHASSTPLHV